MAGNNQTIYVGDNRKWTPTVTGSDTAAVGPDGYDVTVSNNNSNCVQVVFDFVSTSTAKTAMITGLAAGSASLTWTFTPKGTHGGNNATAGPDVITVSAQRTISSASSSYSTP